MAPPELFLVDDGHKVRRNCAPQHAGGAAVTLGPAQPSEMSPVSRCGRECPCSASSPGLPVA